MFQHPMGLRMPAERVDISSEFLGSVACVCLSCLSEAASQRSYHCVLRCGRHLKHIPRIHTFLPPLGCVCLHGFHLPPACPGPHDRLRQDDVCFRGGGRMFSGKCCHFWCLLGIGVSPPVKAFKLFKGDRWKLAVDTNGGVCLLGSAGTHSSGKTQAVPVHVPHFT